jgi:hypothetical protein
VLANHAWIRLVSLPADLVPRANHHNAVALIYELVNYAYVMPARTAVYLFVCHHGFVGGLMVNECVA